MADDRYYNWITNASLDKIDIEALPQFDERNARCDFNDLTNDEIKHLYIQEAIDQHQADDYADHLDEMNAQDN
jgi:hypothetical protein